MGYDMFWADEPAEWTEVDAELDALYDAAVADRAEMERLLTKRAEVRDRLGNYFRLNISGMRLAVEEMERRGMVITSGSPPDLRGADGVQRLAEPAMDQPGIPWWKIYSTNDGWHVLPIEIRGALARLNESPLRDEVPTYDGEPVAWWPEWIAWLAAAAEHNGFKVY